MDLSALLEELPPDRRLALAYAPGGARSACLAVMALDQRLARIVGQGNEPMISQMRLAWWRERLQDADSTLPLGEPILALLAQLGFDRSGLVQLVDGWEALLSERLDAQTVNAFVEGRSTAFAALADHLGLSARRGVAIRMARNWALADLAARLSDPEEVMLARGMISAQDWSAATLPRALRPLTVLHGLARRKQGSGPLLSNWIDGICAVRLGMFGR